MAKRERPSPSTVPGRIAVMDLGSNTARLEIFDSSSGRLETVAGDRAFLKLVSRMDERGRISSAAVDDLEETVVRFAAMAREHRAARVVAVATSAIRDAPNGAEIVNRLQAASGVEIRTITGDTEARCGFAGAIEDLLVKNGVVLDIGGGSMQLAFFTNRKLRATYMLPLGSLRMSGRFLSSDPPEPAEIAALAHHVTTALIAAGVPRLAPGAVVVGAGGTLRNGASVHLGGETSPSGKAITTLELAATLNRLAAKTDSKRRDVRGLSAERSDSIVGGLIVAQTVLRHLGADSVTIAGAGLREGVARRVLTLGTASLGGALEVAASGLG